MASLLQEKAGYVKDRCVNALWMLRNGKFKLMFKSAYVEIEHRLLQLKSLLQHGRNPDYSHLPGSAYVNKRKVLPPSYAPTHAEACPIPAMQVDTAVLQGEIQALRETIPVQEIDLV